MDPDDLPVTPGADAREDQNTSNDGMDSPGWPWGRPKPEALVFLEQALTSDVPRPSYDGPDPRPNMPEGRHPMAQTFTLPPDAPLLTQSVPQMRFTWDYAAPAPKPEVAPQAEKVPDAPKTTTNAMAPPRGIPPPRPQMRGILRKKGSSSAPSNSQAQSNGSASNPRRHDPNGDRRTVKFQLPRGEGESATPVIVPARPRRIIKIKSREAVKHWREVQKKK